jgi:Ca2+-binding RTX toxin-like protein
MKINGTWLNENLVGTSFDDQIYGYGGDDVIHGGDGDDSIDGGSGENWLFGDKGNDTIYSQVPLGSAWQVDHIDGGAGYNTLYLQRDFAQYGWSSLSLDLSDPSKTAKLQDGTTITGIESLTFYGGDETDIVTGGIGNNILCGGGGNDFLTGESLNDRLDGGAGADVLNGGRGDDDLISIGLDPDTIDGGEGIDTAEINRSMATTAYHFALNSNSQTSQDIGDGTTLIHVEKMFFWGGSGDDILKAGSYGDTLHGGIGSDQLYDGPGSDYLDGGDHDDTIYSTFGGFDTIDGGSGNDTLVLRRILSTQNLHLDLTDPSTPQAIGDGGYQQSPHGNIPMGTTVVNVESVEFYGGVGDDVITGGRFSDTLYGYGGNDTLCGGTQSAGIGNVDRLDGGLGNDTLIGGPGADYFMFDSPLVPANVDHIVNFNVASDRGIQADKILLDDEIFTDLKPNMSESAFDALVKETSNGDLYYEGKLFAHLDGAPQLLFSNYVIDHWDLGRI